MPSGIGPARQAVERIVLSSRHISFISGLQVRLFNFRDGYDVSVRVVLPAHRVAKLISRQRTPVSSVVAKFAEMAVIVCDSREQTDIAMSKLHDHLSIRQRRLGPDIEERGFNSQNAIERIAGLGNLG